MPRKSLKKFRATVREALDELAYLSLMEYSDEQIDALTKQLAGSGRASFNFNRFVAPNQVIPIKIVILSKREATAQEIAREVVSNG